MPTSQLLIVCLAGLIAVVAVAAAAVIVSGRSLANRLAIARVEAAARIRTPDWQAAQAPSRVGHRVTVHTKNPDDRTFFGLVVGDYPDYLHLEDASYITPDGSNPALPSRQDLRQVDIAWCDVHELVAPPRTATQPPAVPLPADPSRATS